MTAVDIKNIIEDMGGHSSGENAFALGNLTIVLGAPENDDGDIPEVRLVSPTIAMTVKAYSFYGSKIRFRNGSAWLALENDYSAVSQVEIALK